MSRSSGFDMTDSANKPKVAGGSNGSSPSSSFIESDGSARNHRVRPEEYPVPQPGMGRSYSFPPSPFDGQTVATDRIDKGIQTEENPDIANLSQLRGKLQQTLSLYQEQASENARLKEQYAQKQLQYEAACSDINHLMQQESLLEETIRNTSQQALELIARLKTAESEASQLQQELQASKQTISGLANQVYARDPMLAWQVSSRDEEQSQHIQQQQEKISELQKDLVKAKQDQKRAASAAASSELSVVQGRKIVEIEDRLRKVQTECSNLRRQLGAKEEKLHSSRQDFRGLQETFLKYQNEHSHIPPHLPGVQVRITDTRSSSLNTLISADSDIQ